MRERTEAENTRTSHNAIVRKAECVITKTYKLTHYTDKFRSCLDKSYRNRRNEKLFSAAGQIVLYSIKTASRTNRITMHKDVPVAALRRCAKSRSLNISDCITKRSLPVGQIVW